MPAPFCKDSILEAADAGINNSVGITEGIPTLDMLVAKEKCDQLGMAYWSELSGVITPGECKIGIMPGHIHLPGKVGLPRSGTLTYEAVKQTTDHGLVSLPALASVGIPYRVQILSTFWGCSSRIWRRKQS